jgi:protein-disulfide isomerase
MTGFQASSALLLLTLSSLGSTCHGQSSPGAEATKDTTAPADVTLAGVDASMLTPREKREWSQEVSDLLAPCSDTPVSIAQCVTEKRACSRCLPAAKYVLRAVRDGLSPEQIEKSYHNRFDADRVKNVPLDGSPAKGPDSAPITVIEFADFECPFCAMEAPVLEKMWQTHQSQVRFVYKFFPLQAHPHGESAARAGIAAMNQGKFWEMHDKLFANRDHLEQADVDGYAKELGLDVAKLHTDMASQATTDRIDRDKKLGESVGVQGTPTIFINGRDYDPRQDVEDWLALELQSINGAAPAPAPAPAAPASGTKK